jgi:hypothetical protein
LTEAQFDKVIFSTLSKHWRKVAAIVTRVTDKYEHTLPAITYEVVAPRLKALSEADIIEGIGDLRPSALAVLTLKAVSNLTGACAGKSPGAAPLRMRSI